MILSKMPFIIFFIVVALNLVDNKITMPILLFYMGCRELFIVLRFYKEDKKIKISNILFTVFWFAFTLFLISKPNHLI